MCGRYAIAFTWNELRDLMEATGGEGPLPRFNIGPGQLIPNVRRGSVRLFTMNRWGYVPRWADEGFTPLVNIRSETAPTSRMFRRDWEDRRCVIPASGFFEWQRLEERKQPWYIRRPDGPLLLAGLVASAPDGTGRDGGVGILTTAAVGPNSRLHHRMPVILGEETWREWLEADSQRANEIITQSAGTGLLMHEVSPRVNSVKNDDESLITPRGGPRGGQGSLWS